MATTAASRSPKGIFLVIGLLTIGVVAVTITYRYRTPPKETLQSVLQSRGLPAAKRGMRLSQAGRRLLAPAERAEMDALYAEALRLLPEREGLRFEELRQRGAEAGEREVTEMGGLIQKALRTLPAKKNQRLFALVEKAVDLQLAKQQAAAQTAAQSAQPN